MTQHEALDSFSEVVEKAALLQRIGDLRLYSQEIQELSFEAEASRILLDRLTTLETLPLKTSKRKHIFLFTGHMIDNPGRQKPRFPAREEPVAASAIHDVIEKEIQRIFFAPDTQHSPEILGITGGACGGDILFHEACEAHGIVSHMYLTFPKKMSIDISVRFAGQSWIDRFNNLYEKRTPEQRPVLAENEEQPAWLREKGENYSIWIRNNLWMLNNALVYGGKNVTLFALWDRKKGDGEGGTEDMVKKAESAGAKSIILDTNKLFNL